MNLNNGATLTLTLAGVLAAAHVARNHGLFAPFPALVALGSAARKRASYKPPQRRPVTRKAPKGMLVVTLAAVPNPDYTSDHLGRVRIEVQEQVVADLRQASSACMDFIDEHGLGSGNWAGGAVYDEHGKHVANVSYNGRVWEPGSWPTKQISIKGDEPSGSAARKGALTDRARASLPDRDFAVIEFAGGREVRKYPIHDRRHGQLALTYVMAPSNARYREQVKRAVFARYPALRAWYQAATAKRQAGRRRAP